MASTVSSPTRHYEIGDRVAKTAVYSLYVCAEIPSGRQCLFQIATDRAHNGALDRATFILSQLKKHSDLLEVEYAQLVQNEKRMLNYDLGFPEIIESFVFHAQGGRLVNVIAFKNVPEASRMVPLRNIVVVDQQCVDVRTSAWILGKLLKLLTFAHSQGFLIGKLDLTNILIEPEEHYVVLFDWSATQTFPSGEVPVEATRKEIQEAVRATIVLMGGDHSSRTFPIDDTEGGDAYKLHLLALAGGSQANARVAHSDFYELIVDQLHWRGFHPFTSHNR